MAVSFFVLVFPSDFGVFSLCGVVRDLSNFFCREIVGGFGIEEFVIASRSSGIVLYVLRLKGFVALKFLRGKVHNFLCILYYFQFMCFVLMLMNLQF